MGLAPHVLALNSDTYEVPIQNEEAVLGLTWTGGVVELRDEEATADVEYIVPEDGTLYWMDTWVIFDGCAPPQRGPRVPQLHPRPADPGPGDDHEPLRHAERRGEEVRPGGDPQRPGGVRAGDDLPAASRAPRTPRPMSSATRSGRSSGRASAADPAVATPHTSSEHDDR